MVSKQYCETKILDLNKYSTSVAIKNGTEESNRDHANSEGHLEPPLAGRKNLESEKY